MSIVSPYRRKRNEKMYENAYFLNTMRFPLSYRFNPRWNVTKATATMNVANHASAANQVQSNERTKSTGNQTAKNAGATE